MSDNDLVFSAIQASVQETSAPLLGGALLRKAREAEGLDIAVLAASLKIPVKKLEALEADRFDLLPSSVFVRALASSICRALKIDPIPILEGLPHSAAPSLKTDEAGINTPFRVVGDGSGFAFFDLLSKPVVVAVLALLFGALVIVFFPLAQMPVFTGAGVETASVTSQSMASPPTESAVAAVRHPPAQPSDVARLSPDALVVMNSGSQASLALQSDSAGGTLSQIVPGSGVTESVVLLKAHASSWVEVVDAKGVVQLRKTLSDGEVVSASGTLPLSVVVGRVDSMEVHVRGKPFDLANISKNNIARFEVR